MHRIHILQVLTVEICRLSYTQNSYVLANTLPAELIVEIFMYLFDSGDYKSLVASTHICVRWRAVALEAPKLWTTFPATILSETEECLRRSGSLLLSLSYKVPHEGPDQILKLIAAQTHRLRSLKLIIGPHYRFRRLVKHFRAAVPNLEELSIMQEPIAPRSRMLLSSTDPVPILTPFGGSELRSLRTLILVDVPIPIRPSSSNLLHLTITCRATQFSGQDILGLLDISPLLKTFTFTSLVLSPIIPPDTVRLSTQVISLPRLQLYKFECTSSGSATVLRHLSIPNSARLLIHSHHVMDLPDGNVYGMLPENVASDRLKCFKGIKRIELLLGDSAGLATCTIRAYHDPEAFLDPAVELVALLIRGLPAPFMGHWPFDTSQVEVFVVAGKPGRTHFAYDAWAEALRRLPELRCLRVVAIRDDCLVALASVLEGRGGDPLVEEAMSHLKVVLPDICPMLTTLEVVNISPRIGVAPLNVEIWAALWDAIAPRLESGALKEMELFNVCGCRKGDLGTTRLQELVGKRLILKVDEID